MSRARCAILGSGNIGTDLLVKVERLSGTLEVAAVAGIDPESEGLRYAARRGFATTSAGLEGLAALPEFPGVDVVFDATSAAAHRRHAPWLKSQGKRVVDLTPAAMGPGIVPPVNMHAAQEALNVSMISCGGQATIPIVAAVACCTPVHYAEIVASIASRSAGPGTRANIDEFTDTTARGIVSIGGARRGKAIIVLNPAEPPLVMRDTVYCLCEEADEGEIARSVQRMVAEVQRYVPGYRLKQDVQFECRGGGSPLRIPGMDRPFQGLQVTVFLEVEGAGHHLPRFAGNLDIMTSAALRTAERMVDSRRSAVNP